MTLSQQIAEAKAQYHKLQMGQVARVYVDQNGERVEFVAASKGALLAYIRQLEAELSRSLGSQKAMGPIGVRF